eukprot:TRINITY_DN947_c0_g1_i1.p1 TRINITY_DN947_c0_g1~~TRINITY_DN947_c0_g1_i1.p1  ORF type:complete len:340 (-),score=77.14 TRINITY_DN947_c0_g1_i1:16-1035(-)
MQIAAGDQHSLIMNKDGNIFITGRNLSGSLGIPDLDADKLTQFTPFPITEFQVKTVVAGASYYAFLTTDNEVYLNGIISSSGRNELLKQDVEDVKTILAAQNQFYVIKEDGSLYARGNNSYGQFGQGHTESWIHTYNLVAENIRYIDTGDACSTMVDIKGCLYGWGLSSCAAALGNRGKTIKSVSFPHSVQSVACGNYFTAVLTESGQVYAAGIIAEDSSDSSVGDGNEELEDLGLDNIVQIDACESCLFAVKDNGDLFVIGTASFGEIGMGNHKYQRQIRLAKHDLEGVVAISCSKCTILALTKDDQVYGWGLNAHGELGLGDVEYQLTPTVVFDGNQ